MHLSSISSVAHPCAPTSDLIAASLSQTVSDLIGGTFSTSVSDQIAASGSFIHRFPSSAIDRCIYTSVRVIYICTCMYVYIYTQKSAIVSHNCRRSPRTFVGDLIAAQRSFRCPMCTYASDLIAYACTSPDFGSRWRDFCTSHFW